MHKENVVHIYSGILLFNHQVVSDSLRPHGLPHHLLEFSQIHVHSISDTIQPTYPLLPFLASAFNLSKHQGLFQ